MQALALIELFGAKPKKYKGDVYLLPKKMGIWNAYRPNILQFTRIYYTLSRGAERIFIECMETGECSN